jgi:hypothetical protein
MSITYEAKTPFGHRLYDLDEDTVSVRGDIPLQGRFEVTIALSDLDPRFERIWIRSQFFAVGMWFFAIGLIAYLIETTMVGMDGWGTACLFTLMWAFIGAVLLGVGLKKYQIGRFKTKAGVPAIDVFEEGPMKSTFPSFLSELVNRISPKKKEPNQPPEPTAPSGRGSS